MQYDADIFIEQIIDEIIEIRRTLHENPELSEAEFNTSKLILAKLKENGIDALLMTGAVGVTALIRGGKPGNTVAYRADIDALPMEEKTNLEYRSKTQNGAHTCGHDIHTAVLLGTALVLNKLRSELCGNVRIIFQSAEENGTGANTAIKYGVLHDPDLKSIIALHTWPELPAGTIGLKKGAMMASSSTVRFKITGKGGHGAHPHKGVDPVTIAAYTLTAIQSIVSRNVAPLDSAVITFGMLQAGTAVNIIPDYAVASGTVRTLSTEVSDLIENRLKEVVEYQAKSFGATGEVEYHKTILPLVNDSHIVDVLNESSKASIGEENICWLEQPSMGGEDFANYLETVPGALVRLGTANDAPESKLSLHNTAIIFDEKSIITGIRFMIGAVLSLLDDANGIDPK